MDYSIELNVNGKKTQIKGNAGLLEITDAGDAVIKKAIKESE